MQLTFKFILDVNELLAGEANVIESETLDSVKLRASAEKPISTLFNMRLLLIYLQNNNNSMYSDYLNLFYYYCFYCELALALARSHVSTEQAFALLCIGAKEIGLVFECNGVEKKSERLVIMQFLR